MILSSDTCVCVPNAHPAEDGESCECDSFYHWDEESYDCALDTTSHQFNWIIDTLATSNRSTVNSLSIIDQNDIWAAGIFETDSGPHNIAHWNGIGWQLTQTNIQVENKILNEQLAVIKAFSENDIWALGSWPIHWDGDVWTRYNFVDQGIIAGGELINFWCSDPDNIYFIGHNGLIVHYDGSGFNKIECNIDIRLRSISGSENGEDVFIIGDINGYQRISILHLNNNAINVLYDEYDYRIDGGPQDWGLVSAVAVQGDTAYFSTYQGLMKLNFKNNSIVVDKSIGQYGFYPSIKIISPNDMFLITADGGYRHFNGSTWANGNDLLLQHNFSIRGSDTRSDINVVGGNSTAFDNKALVARAVH